MIPVSVRKLFQAKSRRWSLVAIASAASLFLVEQVTGNWITTTAIPSVWRGVRILANKPIGVFGLAVVVLIAVAVLLALLDSSPTAAAIRASHVGSRSEPAPPEAPQGPLTIEEQNHINFARVFWRTIGANAAGHNIVTLMNCQTYTATRTRLAALLRFPIEEMRDTRDLVENALGDHAKTPLAEIIWRVERHFRTYMEGVRWIHLCESEMPEILKTPSYVTIREKWWGLHHAYISELSKLAIHPAYQALQSVVSINCDKSHFESLA